MYKNNADPIKQSEHELTVQLIEDLDKGFKQLVSCYQKRLYAFVSRQTNNVYDAEDIVQETFMQAYFALRGYPPHRINTLRVLPWLYKIALNNFYMQLRQSKVQAISLDILDDLSLVEPEVLEQTNQEMEDENLRHELERLLSDLPEHYRTAVNLYYFQHLSYQEIADILNIPINTVKSHLYRGIRLLRRAATPGRD